MFSGTNTLDRPHGHRAVRPVDDSAAGQVLASAREHRRISQAAEAALLGDVLAWCELHVTDDPDEGATWGDVPVHLGGQGCPWVREFTITELAAGLGLSLPAARGLVSDVLEMAFRLPRLWARVHDGGLASWRARRIAAQTQTLTLEAAGFVDAQVAPFADKLGAVAVERAVEDATIRYMPDVARAQREAAADGRRFDVDRFQVSFVGTSRIEGELDLADAVDLDHAIATIAEDLKTLYPDLPLDQRRAMAAGQLARRQLGLPEPVANRVETQPASRHAGRTGERRDVILYAHLSSDAVLSLEGHSNPILTPDAFRDLLDIPSDVHLTVRPVIDLNANLTSSGRFATDLQRVQITLRDRTCAAPYCQHPARHLDLDHIDAWDDTGPPGVSTSSTSERRSTESANLAPLCRHHHRAKTFTGWTYQQLVPGVFLWESPHGLHHLTYTGHTLALD
ncbi:MAG TPA: hypothetical protein VF426_09695 [Marmoricola sp.]